MLCAWRGVGVKAAPTCSPRCVGGAGGDGPGPAGARAAAGILPSLVAALPACRVGRTLARCGRAELQLGLSGLGT